MGDTVFTNIGLIVGSIILILGNTFVDYLKRKLARKKEYNALPLATEIGVKINKCLDEIRIKLDAERVHILGYHNGTTSFNGYSFKFFSMIYESVADNVANIMKETQSIPCGLYWELLAKIQQNGIVRIPEDEDSYIGRFHRSVGIKDSYKFRIGDNLSNGSLSIIYHFAKKDLTPEQIHFVQDKIFHIETLLKAKQ